MNDTKKLLKMLCDNTEGFTNNGEARATIKGKPYVLVYTDVHKSVPTNTTYKTHRQLEDFYDRDYSKIKDTRQKHLLGYYNRKETFTIDDPLQYPEKTVESLVAKDINKALRHGGVTYDT